ncbi:MAG: biopolymer transporter ExbD [Puniceicoccales bacterium]|jgi:biopolymer transport protein ExbD|nr:biopolymer transporter ExbD [Puniceicoccales bacterium]
MGGGGGGEGGEPEFQIAPMIDVLLVLLIFFMSITTDQTLKVDKDIKLPLAANGQKRDDKADAAVGLINIGWVAATNTPRYKLDDKLILNADMENPGVEGTTEPLVEVLKKRKSNNDKFRMLIRADKNIQAKYLQKALQWGANAGIDNIAFSGVNKQTGEP